MQTHWNRQRIAQGRMQIKPNSGDGGYSVVRPLAPTNIGIQTVKWMSRDNLYWENGWNPYTYRLQGNSFALSIITTEHSRGIFLYCTCISYKVEGTAEIFWWFCSRSHLCLIIYVLFNFWIIKSMCYNNLWPPLCYSTYFLVCPLHFLNLLLWKSSTSCV